MRDTIPSERRGTARVRRDVRGADPRLLEGPNLAELLEHPSGWGRNLPNVVLVGASDAGKSRTSRRLAKVAGWERVSTDERFEELHGPISRFVEEFGWERFRNRETELLAGISGQRLVVECGEGILERPENLTLLRELGTVYWVRTPVAKPRKRLAKTPKRPALTATDPTVEVTELLEQRSTTYRMASESDIWNPLEEGDPRGNPVTVLLAAHFGPRVAFTVAGRTVPEMRAGIAAAWAEAGPRDLIELRLDHLEEPVPGPLGEVLEGVPPQVRARMIATVRRSADGGCYSSPEPDRVTLLLAAARSGAGYLDLELEADGESGWDISRRIYAVAPRLRVIASCRCPDGLPADLDGVWSRTIEMKPAIRKIVADSVEGGDLERLLGLIDEEASQGRAVIGIAGGPVAAGLPMLAQNAGAALAAYVSPSRSREPEDKRLPAREVRARHSRWGARLHAPVPVYGVVGHPLAPGLIPAIYESAFRRAGIDASYVGFEVPPDELEAFLAAARLSKVAGLSVAAPHQETILPLLDETDETARRIGAVDAITLERGRLAGANTFWRGVIQALEEESPLVRKRATVIGAGGAARSVTYGLLRCGAQPTVVAPGDRSAAELAATLGAAHLPFAEFERARGDILINAAAVGMSPRPDESPATRAIIRNHSMVLDLAYSPRETRLLTAAKALGKRTMSGINPLIYRAVASFQLWTGRPAPTRAMTEAAQRVSRILELDSLAGREDRRNAIWSRHRPPGMIPPSPAPHS